MTLDETLIDLSPKAERVVARQYMGRIQWEMILIGVGQSSIWITTLVLSIIGVIPLWLGFIITTLCMCMAYLPSHEGQHGNLSGRQERWKWIDPLVGQISLLGLKQSHEALRVTHMKHHAHTNDPELDTNYDARGDHWWQPALAVHRGDMENITRHAERDPAFFESLVKGVTLTKFFSLIQLIMVILFPLETLLAWWLPSKIGLSYIYVYFAWEPHRPGTQTGRYTDTRFWTIPVPRFLCHSMQTHVIHHMYPTIPHWDEPKAMEALRPFMIERDVPGAQQIPARVRFNPLLGLTNKK